MIGIVGFFAALLGACQGLTVTIAPYNTSAEAGGNCTLACIVTNAGSDSVTWKKQGSDGSYTPITLNAQSLTSGSNNRYFVTSTYNLTITNFQSSDEGQYECVAGSITHTASASLVVMPTNVSVYWDQSPTAGNTVNLTCRATFAKPPPFLRWYKNGVEVTTSSLIDYRTDAVQSNGYGDAVSTLKVALRSTDEDKLYRCQVDFEGYYDVMEYTLQVTLSGSSAIQAQTMLAAVLVAAAVTFRSI